MDESIESKIQAVGLNRRSRSYYRANNSTPLKRNTRINLIQESTINLKDTIRTNSTDAHTRFTNRNTNRNNEKTQRNQQSRHSR
jgi:hypothetical protein